MLKLNITDEQAEKLVQDINKAVEKRIEEDDCVYDAYLRINPQDLSVTTMYLEESNLTYPTNEDTALLNLMYEISELDFVARDEYIRDYVESIRQK